MKELKLSEIAPFMRALHCPTRWDIIKILQNGSKSSDEIYGIVSKESKMQKPAFYYHLRELEAVGIIGLDEYKASDKKRAPEKVWKLLIKELKLNFMK